MDTTDVTMVSSLHIIGEEHIHVHISTYICLSHAKHSTRKYFKVRDLAGLWITLNEAVGMFMEYYH